MEEGADGTPRRAGAARASMTGLVPAPSAGAKAPAAGKAAAAAAAAAAAGAAAKGGEKTTTSMRSDEGAELQKVERPDERVVTEIVGCLKMKNSMLAMGACERVKKITRVYPLEVANCAIMDELIDILKEGPATPLAGSVMQALSVMALHPEGRQKVCRAGASLPLIHFIRAADLSRPNLDRGVTLLMNLAADTSNRRSIREHGGVEALVEVLRVAPISEPLMEHALGGLHNLALLDAKAKARALDAGILGPLVRITTARGLPETDMCAVRGRMILTELLKMPETEELLAAVAAEMGVKL
ncbi:hypothetical protein HYH02_006966 [Chlamydomonas schloesseri]|uniref:Uncharacterized protein n=1 Tax=Chlamydomonas schloesseri TaxID=2026947 RepID=A0A835WJI4_9CHLO|nr:hypothetical protein HYH02_006966 [Chlamydomonas schloesseri]|eukprot:KAG2448384.1 hypothetical protein HYH02_006966 [Chlamydomonas schloesseri]